MKVGRNDPCPCGSGKKYKYCCYAKDSAKREASMSKESEGAVTDETVVEERKKQPSSLKRNKRRAQFHGDSRGRGSSFQSRSQRGSQRGT